MASPEHRVFPYLLRDVEVSRADHVWCADITYVPVARGFFYLVAVMDWATRHVLAWDQAAHLVGLRQRGRNQGISDGRQRERHTGDEPGDEGSDRVQNRLATGLFPGHGGREPRRPSSLPSERIVSGRRRTAPLGGATPVRRDRFPPVAWAARKAGSPGGRDAVTHDTRRPSIIRDPAATGTGTRSASACSAAPASRSAWPIPPRPSGSGRSALARRQRTSRWPDAAAVDRFTRSRRSPAPATSGGRMPTPPARRSSAKSQGGRSQ